MSHCRSGLHTLLDPVVGSVATVGTAAAFDTLGAVADPRSSCSTFDGNRTKAARERRG